MVATSTAKTPKLCVPCPYKYKKQKVVIHSYIVYTDILNVFLIENLNENEEEEDS